MTTTLARRISGTVLAISVLLLPLLPLPVFADGTVTAADLVQNVNGDVNNVLNIVELPVAGGTVEAPLTVIDLGIPQHGSAETQNGGTLVVYTPTPKYSGPESFSYTVSNGTESATANFVFTVLPGNTNYTPVDIADSYSDTGNMSVSAENGVLANDTDTDGDFLTAVLVSNTAHGTLTLSADGSFTYVPGITFTGIDSFSYKSNDGKTDGNVVTVSLSITFPPSIVGEGEDLQAALDAATEYSVVTVTGAVAEGDITITKPLQLVGEGGTVTGTLTIASSGVTVSHLTVQNPNGTSGIVIEGVSNVTLADDTITDIGTALSGASVVGLRVRAGGDAHTISVSDLTITDSGNSALTRIDGIQLGEDSDTGTITGTITDSTVTNLAGGEVYGITFVHGASSVNISTSTISDLTGTTVAGLYIEAGAPVTNLRGNTFSSFSGSTDASALLIASAATTDSVSLYKNTLLLAGIAHGVVTEDDALAFSARENFWGEGVSPVDSSSDGVSVSPWYADDGMHSLAYTTTLDDVNHTRTAHVMDATAQTTVHTTGVSPVALAIPADTLVTSTDTSWNGVIEAPTATSTDIGVVITGYHTDVTSSIEVGSPTNSLTLDHAARIVFTGQGGLLAGWIHEGSDFTYIDTVCDSDTQDWADENLVLDVHDCATTVGSDLVVWTKHFTQFATFQFMPELDTLSLTSSNVHPGYAKVGDTVTLNFTSLIPLDSAAIKFMGASTYEDAVLSGDGLSGSVSYTLQSDDSEGEVTFDMSFLNSDNASNSVTQSGLETPVIFDRTAPSIEVPKDMDISDVETSDGAVVTYEVEVGRGDTVICTPSSGSIFPIGTTTVVCSAEDSAGNTSGASFDVTLSLQEGGSHRSSGGSLAQGNGTVGDGEVLGASAFNFVSDLTIGSRGDEVIELQKILIAEGYLEVGLATGYFGPLTQFAVKLYQSAHNVNPISGYVGPLTRAVLNRGTAPTMSEEKQSLLDVQIKALSDKILELQGKAGGA